MARAPRRRNALTVAALLGIVAGMGGLAYASVPLYQWFCQVTGFGGTTQVADRGARANCMTEVGDDPLQRGRELRPCRGGSSRWSGASG